MSFGGRNYAVTGSVTNTASATLPLLGLVGGTGVRTAIYDITIGGNATPADNYGDYAIQRSTTAGTAGSNPTPNPIDGADGASVTTAGLAVYGAGPTITASSTLYRTAVNQRATFRWVASPGSELRVPATASNGLVLMCLTTNTAFATDLAVLFYE